MSRSMCRAWSGRRKVEVGGREDRRGLLVVQVIDPKRK